MKLHLEERKYENNSSELANITEEKIKNHKVDANLLSVSRGNVVVYESWILDSICSYHILLIKKKNGLTCIGLAMKV